MPTILAIGVRFRIHWLALLFRSAKQTARFISDAFHEAQRMRRDARTGSTPRPASPGNERRAPQECREGPRRVNGISQKMASPRARRRTNGPSRYRWACAPRGSSEDRSAAALCNGCATFGATLAQLRGRSVACCATLTQLSGQNGLPSRQPAATATAASHREGSAHATSATAIHRTRAANSSSRRRSIQADAVVQAISSRQTIRPLVDAERRRTTPSVTPHTPVRAAAWP